MSDKIKILVCEGKHCQRLGAKDVYRAFKEEREDLDLEERCAVKKSDCLGMCGKGPGVYVKGLKISLKRVSSKDCRHILKSLCGKNENRYVPD